MLSKSVKYLLKAVLFLAVNSNENKKVMVKDIAKSINVPQAYIAKLLQELSKQKMISSTRGPKGGFYLSNSDRKQSVLHIIYAIDSEKKMSDCLLSLNKCNEQKPCPLHSIANPIRTELLKKLSTINIDELAQNIKFEKSFLPL